MEESEITFVVQGPILIRNGINLTALCLNSIRSNFPKTTVILSTHPGESPQGLAYDLLIVNQTDAREIVENDRVGNTMTMNLQSASSISGLRAVQTKYAIKIRSDMVVLNKNLLFLLENRPVRVEREGLTLTEEMVIVLNWTTVDPRRYLKLAHHPSDHLFAGKTSDLIDIWSVPNYPVEFMRWFENNPYPVDARHGNSLTRYRCETWIWMNYVSSSISHLLESSYQMSEDILEESMSLMVHNLQVVSPHMAGVDSLKNSEPSISSKAKMLTHLDWILLSRANGVKSNFRSIDFESFKVFAFRVFVNCFKRLDLIFPTYSTKPPKISTEASE